MKLSQLRAGPICTSAQLRRTSCSQYETSQSSVSQRVLVQSLRHLRYSCPLDQAIPMAGRHDCAGGMAICVKRTWLNRLCSRIRSFSRARHQTACGSHSVSYLFSECNEGRLKLRRSIKPRSPGVEAEKLTAFGMWRLSVVL